MRDKSNIFKIPLSFEKWLFGSKWELVRNKEYDISDMSDSEKTQISRIGNETGLWKVEKRLILVPTDNKAKEEFEILWRNEKHITIGYPKNK